MVLTVFLSTICQAQIDFKSHHQSSLEAQRAFSKQDYSEALAYYKTAFEVNGAIRPIDYLNAALCAAELNNETACSQYIEASIQNEKLSEKTILNQSENELYKKCAAKTVASYDIYLEQFYENLANKAMYFKIEKLLYRDQFSRKLSDYYLNLSEEEKEIAFEALLQPPGTIDSLSRAKYKQILFPEVDEDLDAYQTKIIQFTDSLNVREFMEITEKYGYQSEGWLLLWHQRGSYGEDNWVWNYFKPLIDQEIKAGNISPAFWAMFEDILAISKTGQSVYGYHPGKVNSTTVNDKRQEIGLPKLTEAEINQRNNNPYGGSTF